MEQIGRPMKNKKILIIIISLASVILILYIAGKSALKAKNEFFYPTIVNSIPPLDNDLDSILSDLKIILKAKNEPAYSLLNQPLTADDIKKLEEKYKVEIPEEIESLYMWHNGCGDFKNGYTHGTIIPGHWFVPLEHALESRHTLNQSNTTLIQKIFYKVLAGHRKNWVVLLDDGCGDGYFYDFKSESGSGYVFYHFTEIGHYVFFSSLKNMLQAFIECYQKDIYIFECDNYTVDYEAAQKIMSKYGNIVF
jgi:cell wall assembly regulator SMI1